MDYNEARAEIDAAETEWHEWESTASSLVAVLQQARDALDAEMTLEAVVDALTALRMADWSSPKAMNLLQEDMTTIENALDEIKCNLENEETVPEDDGETDDEYRARVARESAMLPFTVGLNVPEGLPVRLARFATHDEAAKFIDQLEDAEEGRYFLDGPEVCECDDTATPGIAWPIESGGDDSFPFVEKCDMCKRYADDIEAAKALCALLESVGYEPTLVNVFDTPGSAFYKPAVFPTVTDETPWRVVVDEALFKLKRRSS